MASAPTHATIPGLLRHVAGIGLRAEDLDCQAVQGRPCECRDDNPSCRVEASPAEPRPRQESPHLEPTAPDPSGSESRPQGMPPDPLCLFCNRQPHCEAHGVACPARHWSLSALVRHLEQTGWPDMPAAAQIHAWLAAPRARLSYRRRRRELRLDGRVVLRFRRKADNQIAVLKAFQAAGWPPAIDNPLGRPKPWDAKHRLSDAIAGLNRRQGEPQGIHFWVERGTQVVHWKFLDEASAAQGLPDGPPGT